MKITLKDLARLAGVSHTAVSVVMRNRHQGRVSAAKRREILALARRHGYRPNVAARGLVQQRTYRLALCIHGHIAQRPMLGQFSFHDALARAARKVVSAGYSLELVETDLARPFPETCRTLTRRAVDGLALLGWPPDLARKAMRSLGRKRIPSAAIGATLADDRLTWSDVDRPFAMRAAVSLLAGDGRSRPVLLDLDVGGSYRKEKRDAFREEMARRHGPRQRAPVLAMREPHIEEAIRITREALDQVPGVNALILTDNFFADAVMLALRQRGIEPGRECRLIGLGDTILADRTHPRLTHYSLMVAAQVEFAIDALLEHMAAPEQAAPRHRIFEPILIRRET